MHTDIHSKVLVRIKTLYTAMSEERFRSSVRDFQSGRKEMVWVVYYSACVGWLNLTTLVNLISLSEEHEKAHMTRAPLPNCNYLLVQERALIPKPGRCSSKCTER